MGSTCTPLCFFLVSLLLGQCSLTRTEPERRLNVLGITGVVKSHAFAVIRVLEELANQGHNVTFLLPNQDETKEWFSEERNEPMHFVFDGNPEFVKPPDIKKFNWVQTFHFFADFAWHAKQTFEVLAFPMDTPTTAIINRQPPESPIDVVVVSMMNLGSRKAGQVAGVPVVSYMHAPLLLDFVCANYSHNIRFPSMMSGVSQDEIKNFFGKRLWNQVIHVLFDSFLEYIIVPALSGIIEKRYGEKNDFKALPDIFTGTWAGKYHMALGGAPLSNPLPQGFSPYLHVLGVVGKNTTKEIKGELQEWFDLAEKSGATVLYLSMGTIYSFSEESVAPLLAQIDSLLRREEGQNWVLWSLREQQQQLLHSQIEPLQSSHPLHLHIATFTPQPAVLAHPAVKIFLSHCGWGGMTDTLLAGKPVLAYPTMGDQLSNAVSVVQSGAGLRLKVDFSDLEMLAVQMLKNYEVFAGNMRQLHQGLEVYGGMEHAVRLVERLGRGGEIMEEERVMEARERADEYFVEHSQWEARLLAYFLVFLVIFLVILVGFLFFVCLPWKLFCFCCGNKEKRD